MLSSTAMKGEAVSVPARIAGAGEVLQLVRSGVATTTSQISVAMSVARSTVNERIELLLRHGLLVPDGETALGRGRPALRYAFNAEAGFVLAVQLGMSGARIALTDLSARVLESQTVDVDLSSGPRRVFDVVTETMNKQLRDTGMSRESLLGVGLGVPGRTELASVRFQGGQPWDDVDVESFARQTFGVPVYIDQDVNLLALAEHRWSHPTSRAFACLKVGTTMGCGIVIEDKVFRGGSGLAGEISHTAVTDSTQQCGCGNRGCLNATASGAALVARLGLEGLEVSSTRELAQRAAEGNVAAIQAIRQAGREIGEVLSGVVNLLNPEVLAVWGYLDDAGDYLLAGIRESIYTGALPAISESLKIVHASLGNDAGVQGAATGVIEHITSTEAIEAWISSSKAQTS